MLIWCKEFCEYLGGERDAPPQGLKFPLSSPWWGVRVRGPAIDWVGTLQDASEQTAEGICLRLEPLVRVAAAEALYRGSRTRSRTRS